MTDDTQFLFAWEPQTPCVFCDRMTGSRLVAHVIVNLGTLYALQVPCCPGCYLRPGMEHEHRFIGIPERREL